MTHSLERGIRFYNSKKYELALRELKASGLDPEENPEVAYYIGLAYTRLEEWDQSLFYLEQVVNSSENFLHIYQCRMVLGYIYSMTGRLKLAEFEFKKIAESGMESPQVYATLGYVAYTEKRVSEAVAHLERALELQSDYPNALNSLGYICVEEGLDIPRGLELCKQAVSHNPQNPAYLDSLGWAYYKADKPAEARSYLRRALDLLPGNREISVHLKAVLGSE